MPTRDAPSDRLAEALAALQLLQAEGHHVYRSSELTRTHRERLHAHGFLAPVMKGWWMATSPDKQPGDSTPWYASFWEFCRRYATHRFGGDWHLSPEQSLRLHAGDRSIPTQVVIYAPEGGNNPLDLLFETGLFDLRIETMPPGSRLETREGLQLFTLEAGLVEAPPAFYRQHPVSAEVALSMVEDISGLLRLLLEGGHSTIAGRLAGALRRLGRGREADEILGTFRSLDFDVRESNPFDPAPGLGGVGRRAGRPLAARVDALWSRHRKVVEDVLAGAPRVDVSPAERLELIDEGYRADAYHSLSIEGYRVTPGLIERVRSGDWDQPKTREEGDQMQSHRDALAARGYWLAFQEVRDAAMATTAGGDAVGLAREGYRGWYRQLFQPSVTAGVIPATALAGHRDGPVYLRGSRHVPPRAETVPEAMDALCKRMDGEANPAVRAVLGHWLFGWIHPFPDGNGRLARFLMNLLLVDGGFGWTVIRVGDRDRYLGALEQASVEGELEPFAQMVLASMLRD